MPGNVQNTLKVIDWVNETFKPGDVVFSLMSQYTPLNDTPFPELARPVSEEEHERAIRYLEDSGIEDGFYQDRGSASESFIPEFNNEGV